MLVPYFCVKHFIQIRLTSAYKLFFLWILAAVRFAYRDCFSRDPSYGRKYDSPKDCVRSEGNSSCTMETGYQVAEHRTCHITGRQVSTVSSQTCFHMWPCCHGATLLADDLFLIEILVNKPRGNPISSEEINHLLFLLVCISESVVNLLRWEMRLFRSQSSQIQLLTVMSKETWFSCYILLRPLAIFDRSPLSLLNSVFAKVRYTNGTRRSSICIRLKCYTWLCVFCHYTVAGNRILIYLCVWKVEAN